MLPAAISCRCGFQKCVRVFSISVTCALLRLPSLSPIRVASSSPPAPPPTTMMRCSAPVVSERSVDGTTRWVASSVPFGSVAIRVSRSVRRRRHVRFGRVEDLFRLRPATEKNTDHDGDDDLEIKRSVERLLRAMHLHPRSLSIFLRALTSDHQDTPAARPPAGVVTGANQRAACGVKEAYRSRVPFETSESFRRHVATHGQITGPWLQVLSNGQHVNTRFSSRNRGLLESRTRIQSGFASIRAGLISITPCAGKRLGVAPFAARSGRQRVGVRAYRTRRQSIGHSLVRFAPASAAAAPSC